MPPATPTKELCFTNQLTNLIQVIKKSFYFIAPAAGVACPLPKLMAVILCRLCGYVFNLLAPVVLAVSL